jgi:hypothetical protein
LGAGFGIEATGFIVLGTVVSVVYVGVVVCEDIAVGEAVVRSGCGNGCDFKGPGVGFPIGGCLDKEIVGFAACLDWAARGVTGACLIEPSGGFTE